MFDLGVLYTGQCYCDLLTQVVNNRFFVYAFAMGSNGYVLTFQIQVTYQIKRTPST